MGCGCGGKKAVQKVTKYVVKYNDGTKSDPYTTLIEAQTEKRVKGATAPIETVVVSP